MSMVLSASVVIHNFVSSYSPIGEIIALKRRKLLLPGGHCLFGPPDPEDTAKLINDQFEFDRQRMLARYNFDIVTDSLSQNARQVNLKNNNVVTSSSSSNNNNEGELSGGEDFDENVLSRIRGEDSSKECGDEDGERSTKKTSGSAYSSNFNEGLHKVRKGAVLKRQSHLTDFWRSKRRAWESSSTSKGKLGTEPSSTWKTYCMKSIQ